MESLNLLLNLFSNSSLLLKIIDKSSYNFWFLFDFNNSFKSNQFDIKLDKLWWFMNNLEWRCKFIITGRETIETGNNTLEYYIRYADLAFFLRIIQAIQSRNNNRCNWILNSINYVIKISYLINENSYSAMVGYIVRSAWTLIQIFVFNCNMKWLLIALLNKLVNWVGYLI